MSSSDDPTQLTVSGYTFTAADIGKVIKVGGAGAAGEPQETAITGATAGSCPRISLPDNGFPRVRSVRHRQINDATGVVHRPELPAAVAEARPPTAISTGACLFSGTWFSAPRNDQERRGRTSSPHDHHGARGDAAEDTGGTVFHQMWDQNCDGFQLPDPLYDGDVWLQDQQSARVRRSSGR